MLEAYFAGSSTRVEVLSATTPVQPWHRREPTLTSRSAVRLPSAAAPAQRSVWVTVRDLLTTSRADLRQPGGWAACAPRARLRVPSTELFRSLKPRSGR